MKLINVTSNHHRLVKSQLENTDANLVQVFSAGNSSVIYTEAPRHNEIVIVNTERNILDREIEEVKNFFFKRLEKGSYDKDLIDIIKLEGLVEITIPKVKL